VNELEEMENLNGDQNKEEIGDAQAGFEERTRMFRARYESL
jgi:hypothetical protein